jgi:signal transduction histidine kinase
MIGTTTDITAMRSLSEKLQQNVDLITNLTNEVPGMVFQYRVSPEQVECFPYVSQGVRDIYDLEPAQITANASLIRSIIHPDDLANYTASLESSAENLAPWHLEYRVVLPGQGVRWRHGDARPRRLPDGSTLWHGFITDITDRKTARMLLEQTQDQLLQAEKLAAIGQLAAGVAHEINNPIGFVSSNLGQFVSYITDLFTLIAGYESGESQLSAELQSSIKAIKKHIDIGFIREDVPQLLFQTKDGIDRVQEIVKSLRDFARVDAMHDKHFCDIHSGIESTLNIAWNTLKKKAAIHKEFDRALPEIECVGSQINQVVLNLIVNAAQSIEGNGDIWIKTGSKDGKIFIAVADSGIGIAPEIQARIFEPFFTTKSIGKGTGLGLSVSYGIVQKHGGTIEVKSQPGHGSTFTVWLPVQYSS